MSKDQWFLRMCRDEGLDPAEWEMMPHTEGNSLLAQSNRDTLLEDLGDDVYDNGTGGILYRLTSTAACEWHSSLESYSVANEDDFSSREQEEMWTQWGQNGTADFTEALRERLGTIISHHGVMLSDDSESVDLDGRTADEIIDGLGDGQLWEIYSTICERHFSGEQCRWEEDSAGYSVVSFRAREAAEKWDGMCPVLGTGSSEPALPIRWQSAVTLDRWCSRCNKTNESCAEFKLCDNTGHAFYSDCDDAMCGMPDPGETADTVWTDLALRAGRGEEEAKIVFSDALEQHGYIGESRTVKADKPQWNVDYHINCMRAVVRNVLTGMVRPCLMVAA